MKKISLLILLCLLFTVGKAQITVESGSPQLNTETSIGLVLSDPTNFGYEAGTSTYNVFIEKAGTTYYSSYSSFTMTNVGSGVYHLSSTVDQDVVRLRALMM